MAGPITDISERKRAEREVVESRDLIRLITDNLPVAIGYIDAQRQFRFANKTFTEWLARPAEEIIGKTAAELLGQEQKKIKSRIDDSLAGEQLTYVESIAYPDGVTRTVRATHVPHRGEAGSVEGYFTLVEDITELKQAEEALRERQAHLHAIAENSPAATFLKDTDSRYIFANRVWHDLYNPTDEDIVGKTAHDFLPPEIAEAVAAADARVLETGEPITEELLLPTAQGEPQNILFTKFPVFDEDSNIIALGGFNIDITERTRAEAALHDLSIRLISSQEEERSRIARELHDDFGQRLALISVKLEQLQDGRPGTRDSFVSDTTPLVQAVKELSSDIQRMSHQLHPSILQHLGLLPAIENFCKEISNQHDIHISIVHHGVPHTLSSEVKLCLYRIVQEALRNVVKHANAERVQVEITGAEGELSLQISDNGTGFDPQSAQAHKGLGLVSMRERLRLVNGRISFRQAEPTGTRIDVRVPF